MVAPITTATRFAAISAKSCRCWAVTARLKAVWWELPAWIQAAAAVLRLGRGSQTAWATGSLGSGWSGGAAVIASRCARPGGGLVEVETTAGVAEGVALRIV